MNLSRIFRILFVLGAFAAIGFLALHYTQAAVFVSAVEAEGGVQSGNSALVSDASAAGGSGGKTVAFGRTSIPADAIHAKSYGTVGNGTTNDTAALQAAANAASGKTLYIEPGIYLTSGLTISGPSKVLATGVTLKAAAGGSPLLSIQKASFVEGISLDGNGQNKGGISIANVDGVTVSNCKVSNIQTDPAAINVDHGTNFNVSNCTIDNSSVDAINIFFSAHGRIDNNTISNSGRHGIEWWGGDSARPTGANGVSYLGFDNNKVTNSKGGAAIWGSLGEHITMTNNRVEGCDDVCLDPEGGTDVTVKDNYVHNGKNGGITVFYSATLIEINHNTVIQDPGYGNGIMIYGTGTSKQISILNNIITTNGSDGIFTLDNAMSNSTVTGNDITLKRGGQAVNISGGTGNTVANNTTH